MTLCTKCKAKIPSPASRQKAVNNALYYLGTYYHDALPLADINRILTESGFQAATFSQVGRCHEEVGEGKWLSVTFYRMDSGRWEVVAYVN